MFDKEFQIKCLFVFAVVLSGCDRPATHALPQGSVRGLVPQPHSVFMLGEEVGGGASSLVPPNRDPVECV